MRMTANPEFDAERYCSEVKEEKEEPEVRCAFCGCPMGVVVGDKIVPIKRNSRFHGIEFLPICGDCVANMEDYTE